MANPSSLSPANPQRPPNPQPPTPNPCWYACIFRPPGPDCQDITCVARGADAIKHSASSVVSSVARSSVNVVNVLVEVAQDFSPRYQTHRDDLIVIDVSGLDRLFGDPRRIGEELRQSSTARGLRVQIAIAATRTAAMVLAVARPGLTVIGRGDEGAALAPVSLGVLEKVYDVGTQSSQSSQRNLDQKGSAFSAVSALNVVDILKRWGLKTVGELAALPADELAARLGQQGLTWQTLARGEDTRPLVPTLADERFESSIDLEWPIEGLEPLSFVLTRLLEPLSTRLERRDRGAAVLHVTLGLVPAHDIQRDAQGAGQTGQAGRSGQASSFAHPPDQSYPPDQPFVYTRSLQLPSPMRDVRTLRTLILLDLESHPPAAPIEWVTVVIDPTPGRVLQHALFVRAHPTAEQLSTLIARLNALMGEDRVGRPTQVDSYRPGAFGMAAFPVHDDQRRDRRDRRESFVPDSASSAVSALNVVSALRRCRRPVPARVSVADGRPALVTTDRRGFAGGRVLACAGPWRSSGQWWAGQAGRTGGSGRPGGAGGAGGGTPTHPAHQPYPPAPPNLPFWDRDEWDVSLSDGAVYRIFQDRVTEGWFIDAIVD